MKEQKQKGSLGKLYSPYAADSMSDGYEAYKEDPEKCLQVDGKIFYKIICRAEVYTYKEPTLFVAVESAEPLSVGDILTDEEGRRFTLKCFGMFRFASDTPEWYRKVEHVFIQGEDCTIGNYLCKGKENENSILPCY